MRSTIGKRVLYFYFGQWGLLIIAVMLLAAVKVSSSAVPVVLFGGLALLILEGPLLLRAARRHDVRRSAELLAPYTESLVQFESEAVAIVLTKMSSDDVTASKYGGRPCLRALSDWPQNQEGRFYCFVGQVNFGEVPAFPDSPLPERGVLMLFADFNGECYGDGWAKVIYNEQAEYDGAFPTPSQEQAPRLHKMRFQLITTSPGVSHEDEYSLREILHSDKLIEAYNTALAGGAAHQLLGHPGPIQWDPRWDVLEKDVSKERLLEWVLLWQVDLGPHLGTFGDWPRLYLVIEADKLGKEDFSDVRASFQMS